MNVLSVVCALLSQCWNATDMLERSWKWSPCLEFWILYQRFGGQVDIFFRHLLAEIFGAISLCSFWKGRLKENHLSAVAGRGVDRNYIYIYTSLQSNALWSLRVASGDLKWQCKFERLQIAYSTWELCCQGWPKPRCSKSKDHWIVPLGAMGCWTQMTWKWELNKGNDGDVIGVLHVRIIPTPAIPQSLRKWWSTSGTNSELRTWPTK